VHGYRRKNAVETEYIKTLFCFQVAYDTRHGYRVNHLLSIINLNAAQFSAGVQYNSLKLLLKRNKCERSAIFSKRTLGLNAVFFQLAYDTMHGYRPKSLLK